MERQKKIAAIHDISCCGRCSLTVALPIISSVGIEVSVVPTAVLSTHTGGFLGYTFRDLTADIAPIINHWESLQLEFDAIYTGFLGSELQIELVDLFINKFKKDNTVLLIDPAMADNGKLYSIFKEDYPKKLMSICKKADILTPNITEAAMLLGVEYKEPPHTLEYIEYLLFKLSQLGPKIVTLTGVCLEIDKVGAASYNADSGEISYAISDRVEGVCHGTGDIFASVFLAAYLKGKNIAQCTDIAVNFTHNSIKRTYKEGVDLRYGVNFEEGILELIKACR